MSEPDPQVSARLEEDPVDRIESDEDADVERAWEETDVEEGEAPSA
ncbi:MAG TPA: hypothetical protein VK875_03590 [Euzebyales bacterium]|nr:hypothetical protein [Euzebyales bacterium]